MKQLDEVDIGMTHEELSVYGRLRKIFRWKVVKDIGFPGFQSKTIDPNRTYLKRFGLNRFSVVSGLKLLEIKKFGLVRFFGPNRTGS
jgi:hypothetical protein